MRKLFTSFLLSLTVIVLFSVSNASAKVIANGEGPVTVQKSEIINDDLFIGGDSVTLHGTVNGDVFIGGENANIDGVINGNLHVGASNVNLAGVVKGNVYIGAGTVNINQSVIGGSLILGAGNAFIDKETVVSGSLIAGSGNLSISSNIKRNLILGAGEATLGPEVKVGKDLYYSVGSENGELVIPESASISGTVHKPTAGFKPPEKAEIQKELDSAIRTAKVTASIGGFLSALLIGYLYLTFFKKHFISVSEIVAQNFWKSLAVGFMVCILAIPALLVMVITLIGIPLAGILLLILLIGLYLAKLIVSLVIGKWILTTLNKKKVPVFGSLALGLTVVYLLNFIPVINVLAGILVLWSGLGALSIKFVSKEL